MKTDPDEGRTPLNESVLWRFASQIDAIGEEAQRKLMSMSVLILGATPLGVRVAKRLSEIGIGRIGLFGDCAVTGAHQVTKPSEGVASYAIAELKKWMKTEAAWVQFEPFSGESLDRQLDDVVRGFSLVVATDFWSDEMGKHALESAKKHGIPLLSAQTNMFRGQIKTGELHAVYDRTVDGENSGCVTVVLDAVTKQICDGVFQMALTGQSIEIFQNIELKKDTWTLEVNPIT